MRTAVLLASCVLFASVLAQEPARKALRAVRTDQAITVDGAFDEPFWSQAPPATDFTQFEPVPNVPPSLQSSVRVLYDDRAVYIAAELMDPASDSLMLQLSQRDESAITDYFTVVVDHYNSG
jgi:hypothetical protein